MGKKAASKVWIGVKTDMVLPTRMNNRYSNGSPKVKMGQPTIFNAAAIRKGYSKFSNT